MKKIVLVDASPRQGGNSEIVVDTLAEALAGCEVTVFKMREKDCRFCRACAACQGKETQMCVQRDDITALLPVIDQCDAIVMATPIYNQQITAQAKLFIERWYPFFNREKKNWSNTSRQGKKAALVCSFWGSPKDIVKKIRRLDGLRIFPDRRGRDEDADLRSHSGAGRDTEPSGLYGAAP